jgi:hypothetical protein
MYTRLLRKSPHIRRFTVSEDHGGWLVSEEDDSRLVLSVRYRDWHRVERAMQTFANKAKSLRERGWADQIVTAVVESPSSRPSTVLPFRHEPVHEM